MSTAVLRGDARSMPLPDACVDLIVTSPPYFGLRSYTDGGEHYGGQIGAESTPAEYVAALLECTREWMRVLKPEGSLWVNLGDSYFSGKGAPGRTTVDAKSEARTARRAGGNPLDGPSFGIGKKSLVGLPWRYALGCIDDLGLILRAEVIWSKPNGLPESVTDRVRRSHETWFAFQKSSSVEPVSEYLPFCPQCGRPANPKATLIARLKECNSGVIPDDLSHHVRPDQLMQEDGRRRTHLDVGGVAGGPDVPLLVEGSPAFGEDASDLFQDQVVAVVDGDAEVGVPVGGVAQPNSSLSVENSGKPAEVCACAGHPLILDDEPWLPQSVIAEIMQGVANGEIDAQQAADYLSGDFVRTHSVWFHLVKQPRYFSAVDEVREPLTDQSAHAMSRRTRTDNRLAAAEAGQTSVAHPLGKLPGSVWEIATQPLKVPAHLAVDHFAAFPMEWPRRLVLGWSPPGGVVLDPFGGTGTAALVADVLGRHGISIDRSADYCRLAAWRTGATAERARALGVPKPPPVMGGQGDLFEDAS